MPRNLSLIAVVLLFAGFGRMTSAQAPAAMTVDQLVARNIQAKGGLEKLKAVQTVRQTGHMTVQSMAASLTVSAKRPNLLRQEITIAGHVIINGFDGLTAWLINPLTGSNDPIVVGGPEAEAIREQSDFDGPLVDYKTKGYTVELVGLETMDGKSVHHLKVTSSNQRVQHCYLDATTGLETKIVSETEAGRLEQELSDYRPIDGVTMPFAARTLSNGVLLSEITFDKIEVNPKLDDAAFKMPVKGDVVTRR